MDPEIAEAIKALQALKFPLNRREMFVAFNMMGLASRLQPLQLDKPEAQKLVVQLSIALADQVIAQLDK